jgi:hypothetical protein
MDEADRIVNALRRRYGTPANAMRAWGLAQDGRDGPRYTPTTRYGDGGRRPGATVLPFSEIRDF